MYEKQKLRQADVITSVLLIALGIAVMLGALEMPFSDTYGGIPITWYSSPGLVPLVLGAALVLCSAGVLVRAWRAGGGHRLARDITPVELRANMFTLALLTTLVTATTYALNGMLTPHVFRIAILMLGPYLAGAWIGTSVFHLASPQTFRKIVYVMILMSGLVGLPVFDELLGR